MWSYFTFSSFIFCTNPKSPFSFSISVYFNFASFCKLLITDSNISFDCYIYVFSRFCTFVSKSLIVWSFSEIWCLNWVMSFSNWTLLTLKVYSLAWRILIFAERFAFSSLNVWTSFLISAISFEKIYSNF